MLLQTWQRMQSCPTLTRSALASNIQLRQLYNNETQQLLRTLSGTPFGKSFAILLRKLIEQGFAPQLTDKKLRLHILNDEAVATTAEFYESGEINLKQTPLKRILQNSHRPQFNNSQKIIDLSYLVHEATHAISYALHLRGLFPAYAANTKVNEALAYYAQGFYIKEAKKRGRFTWERPRVPIWDKCVNKLSEVFSFLNINPSSDFDESMDRLFDLQLAASDVDNIPTMPFVSLTHLYESFLYKNKKSWQHIRNHLTPIPVVTEFTNLIFENIDSWQCDLEPTFKYMSERIPLYSQLTNLPPTVEACDYFKQFAMGLLKVLPKNEKTYFDIETWLRKKAMIHGL